MRRPNADRVVSLLALAVSLGSLAITATYVYDRQPTTAAVQAEAREDYWRGTYTVENHSKADARVSLAGGRCEEGARVRPGGRWSADIRPGFMVILCAPGTFAVIRDTIDGQPMEPVTVPGSRVITQTSANTEITLHDAKPKG